MSNTPDEHWSATSYTLTVGPFPASFFAPWPVLPFFHPVWFVVTSVVWMALTYWLHRKGLGVKGFAVIFRRWLQGRHVPSMHKHNDKRQ